MLRILFLILILFGANAFAQTAENVRNETPQAWLSSEVGPSPNGYIKMLFDNYLVELMNNPAARGMVIIYGPPRESMMRERLIRNQIVFRRADPSRIEFVKGGFRNELKNEFWIVPPGAEDPKLIVTARLFAEVSSTGKSVLTRKLNQFYAELQNAQASQSLIINYGTDKQMAQREKIIRENISFRRFDASRITIVRGGKSGKPRTLLWIVPPGAESPQP